MHTDTTFSGIRKMYARLAAPPVFPDRDRTDAAGKLHAVLLTIFFLFAFALLVGLPFLFSNKGLGAAVCLVALGVSSLCWHLMHRGFVNQSGLLLIAILWLTVVLVMLFAQRADTIPFVSVMFVAYLLSGPRLALAVAASAIILIASELFAEPLGIRMPAALFRPTPMAVLVFTVMALVLAALPFALLNQRLRQAVHRLERFRAVQQNLCIITWIWDIGRDRIQWDGDLSPALGLAPGTFSGRFEDYLRSVHPDDAPISKRAFIDCLKGRQQSYRTEERIVWPDGSVHWLAVEGQAELDAGGRTTRMTGIVTDVTEHKIAEHRIRESEQKYSTVFDTCPEAIAVSRVSDGVQFEVNAAWTQQTGYPREKGMGRSALDLGLWLDVADRDRVLALIDAEGHVSNIATRFLHADGSARDVLISATRFSLNGEPCIAWAWRDISELRQLEQARIKSEQRYRTLFDAALDAFVTVSAQGIILDINQFGLQITGYKADELIGKSLEILFDPQRYARAPLRPADVHRLGVVRTNRTIRRKDGAQIPAEIVAGPLPDGNILGIVRDISERKRSQALLQNIARGVSSVVGETFFHSLVANLTKELTADYCFIGEIVPEEPTKVRTLAFRADGAEAANFEYSLTGSPCSLAISRRGSVAFPTRVCEQFPADIGLQRLGVQGYVGTSLCDAAGDGIGILVVMSRNTIPEIGLWTSVLEIFGVRAAAEIQRSRADMQLRELNLSLEHRVRERTAELELANHELESFSYSISHDLRAPLRAINGFAKVLAVDYKAQLDAEASSLLDRITQNAARMSRLIDDVLEFARAGRGTLNPRRIDMRALVDEVIADLQGSSGSGARISLGELPPATGDAVVVRQVWQNLIGNALKFSRKEARPEIEITGTKRGAMIEYQVRDNGAGFDAAYADKLFGVFQRLHTAGEFEGTGIGLAIVRRIVQRHGGNISAEGAVGRGATFRFTLPEDAGAQPK